MELILSPKMGFRGGCNGGLQWNKDGEFGF